MKPTIRFATKEEIPFIMKFINEHWKKGHVLATDQELFSWQYINYGKVNFVLGWDTNNDMQGVLGYIS